MIQRVPKQSPPMPVLVLSLVLGLSLGTGLLFGEPRRIGVDEAVDLALKSNLSLESSRITTETKKRAANTAWNVFIPTVDISGNLIRTNESSSGSTLVPVPLGVSIPGMGDVYGVVPYSYDVSQWHVAGSLSVSLNLSFAMFEAMKRLRLDYQGGLISYDKARVQLERDVRKSYYQMLLLNENIALLLENVDAAQRRMEMARANYQAGLVPELSWLQARVAVENLKPAVDQAENGRKLAMASFAMNLGLPYDTEFELIPAEDDMAYIPLDVADLISKASSGRPDIRELKQSILILQSARKATAYQLYTPYLSLGWNADPTFTGDPWKDKWFDKDSWKQQSGMFRVTLGISLSNLLPWSSNGQNLKNLDDNLRSLNIGLAQAVRGTEIEIYNTVLSLEQARISAGAHNQTLDLAQRSYHLTEEAYKAGLQELLEVQNAELELRKAKIGVLEQNFSYRQGLIDLEYSIGVPFGTLSSGGKANQE